MTDRELMQQALETLEYPGPSWPEARHKAAAALRERLAQPEQEPVAFVDPIWMQRPDLIIAHRLEINKLFARVQFMDYVPLYTAPQPRQWVGLTDEEKSELDAEYGDDTLAHLDAIEAKLKEKNT